MKFITIKYQPKVLGGAALLIILSLVVFGLTIAPEKIVEQEVERIQEGEVVEETLSVPLNSNTKPTIKVHIVQEGENLGTIAQHYEIDVDTLKSANENLSVEIHQGEQLIILPSKGILYTAAKGDSLWHIGTVYGVDAATIMKANGKASGELLIGEKIFIPGAKKAQTSDRQLARSETEVSRGTGQRFSYPATGEVTSAFGYRWGRLHAGIDLADDSGTPIKAARAGRILHAGWYSGYGYTVVIEHDQGYTTLYGHLNDYIVQTGQYVQENQLIAHMGSTGNSTGPHLHFEVWKNGTPMNPYQVLP